MARVGPSESRGSDLRLNAWLLPLQQEISSVRREKETLKSEKETLKEESETLKQRKLQLLKQRSQLLKQRSQLLRQKNKNNELIDPEFLDNYSKIIARVFDFNFDHALSGERYSGLSDTQHGLVIETLESAGMVARAYGSSGSLPVKIQVGRRMPVRRKSSGTSRA